MVVLWCPDWPVAVTGHDPEEPVAVVEAGRVVAASAAARRAGVRLGLRRRDAASRCSTLTLLPRDRALEARRFEPVVAALRTITPLVETVRPGMAAFDATGPTRYFGGETPLARRVAAAVWEAMPSARCPVPAVGIADGRFAATLAARRSLIVPAGASADFLAPMPVGVLDQPALSELLGQLGLRTLGELASLPVEAVRSRFGPDAVRAHELAGGTDPQPLRAEPADPDLAVSVELDPPAEQAETAAFAGRRLAADLVGLLQARGLACTRVRIEAETEHAESLCRHWRADEAGTGGGLGIDMLVERLRWQLDGWLAGTIAEPSPTGGLTRLQLVADEVVPASGHQLGLWGEMSDAELRARRGLDRVRGMLGPRAVFTAALTGGRGPSERVVLVPWGEHRPADDHPAAPWPGHHPRPAPELVHRPALAAEVLGADGVRVTVSARGALSAAPARLSIGTGSWSDVVGWAGPWTADERWWDPSARRRRAWFQLLTTSCGVDVAYLAAVEKNRWWVEATYG